MHSLLQRCALVKINTSYCSFLLQPSQSNEPWRQKGKSWLILLYVTFEIDWYILYLLGEWSLRHACTRDPRMDYACTAGCTGSSLPCCLRFVTDTQVWGNIRKLQVQADSHICCLQWQKHAKTTWSLMQPVFWASMTWKHSCYLLHVWKLSFASHVSSAWRVTPVCHTYDYSNCLVHFRGVKLIVMLEKKEKKIYTVMS